MLVKHILWLIKLVIGNVGKKLHGGHVFRDGVGRPVVGNC